MYAVPCREARALQNAPLACASYTRYGSAFKEITMPEHCCRLLCASRVVTLDAENTILEDAAVAVQKGRIAAVGPREAMTAQWQADKITDLGQAILLPGLVNAHTHAAMTFLRGLADDLPLLAWLTENIFPVEQHLTSEIVEWSTLLGHAEMLRTGTTACVDMYLIEDAVFRAARTSGLRCHGGEAVFNFPGAGSPGPEATLDMIRRQAEHHAHDTRIGVMVCPHAVYTTTPELLRQCRALADELHLPLHIHLAESSAETEQCLQLWGKRPIPYCADLGLLGPDTWLAHVVDATDAELDMLADSGAVVVHNPSSNMKLASGAARVPAMLERGVRVALGTDGAASNNRLNMYTEMGRAALLHKLVAADPTLMPARTVLGMACGEHAALPLRVDAPPAGRIAPGYAADMTALDATAPNLQPMYNPISHLVYAATGMETRLTMVEGEVLYEDGRFTRFDYAALCREMDGVRRWVLRKLGR